MVWEFNGDMCTVFEEERHICEMSTDTTKADRYKICAVPEMIRALKNTCGQICHSIDKADCKDCPVGLAIEKSEGKL